MKKLISAVLTVVTALNLCSCHIYESMYQLTEETERTAPQGEAFSLDGMTVDEMMVFFDSLAVVNNGDDPASYASRFPAPYYPDESIPDYGTFAFYADDNTHCYIEAIEYPTDRVSDEDRTRVIDTSEFPWVEIYLRTDDKELALELYERFCEKLRSWNGTYKSDHEKEWGTLKYYSVEYEELGWGESNISFYTQFAEPDHGFHYYVDVQYPIMW
jgi:hypothetical protein